MPAGRGTYTLLAAPQEERSLRHALEAGKLDKAPDTAVTCEDGMQGCQNPPCLKYQESVKWGAKFLEIISVRIRVQVRVGTEMLSSTKKHLGLFIPLKLTNSRYFLENQPKGQPNTPPLTVI